MKAIKDQDSTERMAPFSSAQPSAHLPRLSNIGKLPLEERHAALAAWTAWVNSNEEKLSDADKRRLDDALHALETDSLGDVDSEIGGKFDNWLDKVLYPEEE